MSETQGIPDVPTEPDLTAERVREERAELWLFIRQAMIVLLLLGLFVAHTLLG